MKFIFTSLLLAFASQSLSFATEKLSLTEKLNLQWQHYESAKSLLIQQSLKQDRPLAERLISRDKWESTLALPEKLSWTAAELEQLKQQQKERIELSRLESMKNSAVNLDHVRQTKRVVQFCSKVPKGGMLHIHPFGTLDRTLAQTLLKNSNPTLNLPEIVEIVEQNPAQLFLSSNEKLWLKGIEPNTSYLSLTSENKNIFESYLFLPPGKHSFQRFDTVFAFLSFAIPTWEAYSVVLERFAQKAVDSGVLYVEFTDGFEENWLKVLPELEAKTGLMIRLNHSFDRTREIKSLETELKSILALQPNKYLVGIDYLDNEELGASFEQGQAIYGTLLSRSETGLSSLRRTMHSGEIGDVRNPRDSMLIGAERLGHAVNLRKDPIALEYAALKKMPIEVNLSSNLRLTEVESVQNHPFLNYLRLGLRVSLSTDDEGIFETDINRECEIAVSETNLTYNEFKKMAFDSIETSFASKSDQEYLMQKLKKKFQEFEKTFN